MRIFRPLILIATAALALAALVLAPTLIEAAPRSPVNGRVAIHGYDPVAYFVEGGSRKGRSELAVERNGARWLFSSAANRARFEADPERYLPAYGGYCAYGVARATSSRSTRRPGRSSMAASTSTTTARSARPGARTCRATCTRPTGTGRGSSANPRTSPAHPEDHHADNRRNPCRRDAEAAVSAARRRDDDHVAHRRRRRRPHLGVLGARDHAVHSGRRRPARARGPRAVGDRAREPARRRDHPSRRRLPVLPARLSVHRPSAPASDHPRVALVLDRGGLRHRPLDLRALRHGASDRRAARLPRLHPARLGLLRRSYHLRSRRRRRGQVARGDGLIAG